VLAVFFLADLEDDWTAVLRWDLLEERWTCGGRSQPRLLSQEAQLSRKTKLELTTKWQKLPQGSRANRGIRPIPKTAPRQAPRINLPSPPRATALTIILNRTVKATGQQDKFSESKGRRATKLYIVAGPTPWITEMSLADFWLMIDTQDDVATDNSHPRKPSAFTSLTRTPEGR
jgi:hypothetical protein